MNRDDKALKAIDAVILANKKTRRSLAKKARNLIEVAAPFFPDSLQGLCHIRKVGKDEVLLGRNAQGARCFYRLLDGDVSVQREVMGEAITLQRVAPGDWLLEPYPCLQTEQTFAMMERDSTLLEVPAQEFMECLGQEPGFSLSWCAELGSQMARMQRRVERICLRQATQRVIHYLITESPGGGGEVELPFTKAAWAAHLGMAAETLSRALTDMVNAGWLEKLHGRRFRLLRAT